MLKLLLLSVFTLSFIYCPVNSFASTYEFYTWGGYSAAVEAWTRVAHVFGNNEYRVLLFIASVAGALVLFYVVLFRAFIGAQVDLLRGFIVPFLGALALVYAFLLPRANIVVYDPVLNRGPHTISDVPRIIALVAYFTNKIERTIIRLIDDSVLSDTAKYSINAGGTLYKGLAELFGYTINDVALTGYNYLRESLLYYVKDCVTPAVERGDINPDHLQSGQIDAIAFINSAKNPAIYTKYVSATGSRVDATCTQAGDYLVGELNSQFGATACSSDNLVCSIIRTACLSSGWAGDVGSLTSCENRLLTAYNDVMRNIGVSSPGLRSAIRQAYVASVLRHALLSDNPNLALSVLATSQTMSQFWGLGVHANTWIPVLKASLTAFAIAITPLIGLFMITPIVGRAFSLLIGLFVWLTLWTVIDAVILSFGRELANNYASALTSGYQAQGFGFAVAMAMPSFTTKVIATFGALRWAGLGLATVFATMLVRFGGAALAMVAGQIAGAPMGSGASYGASVVTAPSTVLTGQVLPAETYGNIAIRMGGLGSAYFGALAEQTFKTASSIGTGHVLGSTFGGIGSLVPAGHLAGRVSAVQLGSTAYHGEVIAGKESHLASLEGRYKGYSHLGKADYVYTLPPNLQGSEIFSKRKPSDIAHFMETGNIRITPDGRRILYRTDQGTSILADYDPKDPSKTGDIVLESFLGKKAVQALGFLGSKLEHYGIKHSGEDSKKLVNKYLWEAVTGLLNAERGSYDKKFSARYTSIIADVLHQKGIQSSTISGTIQTMKQAITSGNISFSVGPGGKSIVFEGDKGQKVKLDITAGGEKRLTFVDSRGVERRVQFTPEESYTIAKNIERAVTTEGAAMLRSEADRARAIKYLQDQHFLDQKEASMIVDAIRSASIESNTDLLMLAFSNYVKEVQGKSLDLMDTALAAENMYFKLLNNPEEARRFIEQYTGINLGSLPKYEELKGEVISNLTTMEGHIQKGGEGIIKQVAEKTPDPSSFRSPESFYNNQKIIQEIINIAGFHPHKLLQEIQQGARKLSPEAIKELVKILSRLDEMNFLRRGIDFVKALIGLETTQEALARVIEQRADGKISNYEFLQKVEDILGRNYILEGAHRGTSTRSNTLENFFKNAQPIDLNSLPPEQRKKIQKSIERLNEVQKLYPGPMRDIPLQPVPVKLSPKVGNNPQSQIKSALSQTGILGFRPEVNLYNYHNKK